MYQIFTIQLGIALVGVGGGKKFKLLFSKNVTLNQILRWILKKGNEV